MDILLCIDGTGDSSDSIYAHDMAHSHVRKIWWHSPLPSDLPDAFSAIFAGAVTLDGWSSTRVFVPWCGQPKGGHG